MVTTPRLVALTLALLLATSLYGGGRGEEGQEGQTLPALDLEVQGTLRSMGLVPLARPQRAPSFPALTQANGSWRLVNFWATWCPPCREELPSLEALHKQSTDYNLRVLAVSSLEPSETVNAFVRTNNVVLPLVIDSSGNISQAYSVRALPTTYLVNPEGYIVAGKSGSMDWAGQAFLAGLRTLTKGGS